MMRNEEKCRLGQIYSSAELTSPKPRTICANLDQWVILLKQKDGKPQGSVYYLDEKDGWFEIFSIDIDRCAFQPALYKELLNAALQDAKRRGGKVMSFFCEEEYENVVRECGIDCVGRYLCYKIHLK